MESGLGRKDYVCDDHPLGAGSIRAWSRLRSCSGKDARSFVRYSPGLRRVLTSHCFDWIFC
ncbi:hypothetical protein CO709_23865 [Burkholderia thailandensis]|nr:hypothetical protein CO709_23865 [Burkholderia thailandensis]